MNKVTVPLINPVNLLLFVLFFMAKISDKIDWSWWWIFSPLWIPLALVLSIYITIGFLLLIIKITELWKRYI